MAKAKYLASCHRCEIAVEVEERVLTEQDNLYCQHCRLPLDFKFLKDEEEARPAKTATESAPQADLGRLIAAMEMLVNHPKQTVTYQPCNVDGTLFPMKTSVKFDPRQDGKYEKAEILFSIVEEAIEKSAADALAKVRRYIMSHLDDYELQSSSGIFDMEYFLQKMLNEFPPYGGGRCYFYLADLELKQRLHERIA